MMFWAGRDKISQNERPHPNISRLTLKTVVISGYRNQTNHRDCPLIRCVPMKTALAVAAGAPPSTSKATQRLGNEALVEMQRARAIRAVAEVLVEAGPKGASIGSVTERALISRATFMRLFGSLEGCLDALAEQLTSRVIEEVGRALAGQESWSDRVIAGLEALLRVLDSEPTTTSVCLLSAGSPAGALERWSRLTEQTMDLIAPPPGCLPGGEHPPRLAAEATLAALTGILRMRMIAGEAPPFAPLLADLTAIVALACQDHDEAAKAMRVASARPTPTARPPRDPERALQLPVELRRTHAHKAREAVRYVAGHPGASNKDIAQGVNIPHLGQVSKLLARLEVAGLLLKRPGGAGRPNAWMLSPSGEIAAQALDRL